MTLSFMVFKKPLWPFFFWQQKMSFIFISHNSTVFISKRGKIMVNLEQLEPDAALPSFFVAFCSNFCFTKLISFEITHANDCGPELMPFLNFESHLQGLGIVLQKRYSVRIFQLTYEKCKLVLMELSISIL